MHHGKTGTAISAVALMLEVSCILLALLFPSSGELSGVLIGGLLACGWCVALAGLVVSMCGLADVHSRNRSWVALAMNSVAALLPFAVRGLM
jgi:hypothetical protein